MRKHNRLTKREKLGLIVLMVLLVCVAIFSSVIKMNWNEDIKIVEIETNKGKITAEIYVKEAPITSENFLKLVEEKFYDGLIFHRYVEGFVIQGGDPSGTGTGGSGKTIPLEINENLKHVKGALAMARTNDPNSATSQFYITLEQTPFLDGSYAVFGKVIEGMDVALSLREQDKMNSIRIK